MPDSPNYSRIRKLDLAALLISVGGLVAVCWWYLFQMADHMPDMSMGTSGEPLVFQAWSTSDFISMLFM